MKLRIYPKGEQRPLLFADVASVTVNFYGPDWDLTFTHTDYIRNNATCKAQSHFSSGNSSGFSFLIEKETKEWIQDNITYNRDAK